MANEMNTQVALGLSQETYIRALVPSNVDLEDADCPLGCARNDEFIITGHDRLHSVPGEFSVVRCRTCGLMRTNPRPTADTMGVYYPDNYGPYIGTRVEQAPNNRLESIKNLFRPLINKIFDAKTDALPELPTGRLLEVGCASGSFLHRMATDGWNVEGVEFSTAAAAAARDLGYKVHTGSLEGAPGPAMPVDLVVGWMVMEHLHDPIACLKKLSEWSKPNAWLVISVPNAESFEFKVFKERWYGLQLPTHLYHFTPASLASVLKAGGWTLQEIKHQRSVTNLFVSMAYYLEDRGWHRLGAYARSFAWSGGICFYIRFPFAWFLSAFGQTGRMTVWARRSESADC